MEKGERIKESLSKITGKVSKRLMESAIRDFADSRTFDGKVKRGTAHVLSELSIKIVKKRNKK